MFEKKEHVETEGSKLEWYQNTSVRHVMYIM
jgi:hypothetical protein